MNWDERACSVLQAIVDGSVDEHQQTCSACGGVLETDAPDVDVGHQGWCVVPRACELLHEYEQRAKADGTPTR